MWTEHFPQLHFMIFQLIQKNKLPRFIITNFSRNFPLCSVSGDPDFRQSARKKKWKRVLHSRKIFIHDVGNILSKKKSHTCWKCLSFHKCFISKTFLLIRAIEDDTFFMAEIRDVFCVRKFRCWSHFFKGFKFWLYKTWKRYSRVFFKLV